MSGCRELSLKAKGRAAALSISQILRERWSIATLQVFSRRHDGELMIRSWKGLIKESTLGRTFEMSVVNSHWNLQIVENNITALTLQLIVIKLKEWFDIYLLFLRPAKLKVKLELAFLSDRKMCWTMNCVFDSFIFGFVEF